jgi:hypothetical protein
MLLHFQDTEESYCYSTIYGQLLPPGSRRAVVAKPRQEDASRPGTACPIQIDLLLLSCSSSCTPRRL